MMRRCGLWRHEVPSDDGRGSFHVLSLDPPLRRYSGQKRRRGDAGVREAGPSSQHTLYGGWRRDDCVVPNFPDVLDEVVEEYFKLTVVLSHLMNLYIARIAEQPDAVVNDRYHVRPGQNGLQTLIQRLLQLLGPSPYLGKEDDASFDDIRTFYAWLRDTYPEVHRRMQECTRLGVLKGFAESARRDHHTAMKNLLPGNLIGSLQEVCLAAHLEVLLVTRPERNPFTLRREVFKATKKVASAWVNSDSGDLYADGVRDGSGLGLSPAERAMINARLRSLHGQLVLPARTADDGTVYNLSLSTPMAVGIAEKAWHRLALTIARADMFTHRANCRTFASSPLSSLAAKHVELSATTVTPIIRECFRRAGEAPELPPGSAVFGEAEWRAWMRRCFGDGRRPPARGLLSSLKTNGAAVHRTYTHRVPPAPSVRVNCFTPASNGQAFGAWGEGLTRAVEGALPFSRNLCVGAFLPFVRVPQYVPPDLSGVLLRCVDPGQDTLFAWVDGPGEGGGRIRTREYHHLARSEGRGRRATQRLAATPLDVGRDPAVPADATSLAAFLARRPDPSTGTVEGAAAAACYDLGQHWPRVVAGAMNRARRRDGLDGLIAREQATASVARKLCARPKDDTRRVLLAVGDRGAVGARGIGTRHGLAGPVLRVLKYVRAHDLADVVLVPEAFTSQFCSQDACVGLARQLSSVLRPPKQPRGWTREKGVRHERELRSWSSRRLRRRAARRRRLREQEQEEEEELRRVRRALRTAGRGHRGGREPDGDARRVPCHGVRVCKHCRTYWQRDVNAARNIRYIFLHAFLNDGALPEWQAWRVVQAMTDRRVG